MPRLTAVEQLIDGTAHRLIDRAPDGRIRAGLVELLVFGAKQAWAALFGGAMLAILVATQLWYPAHAALDGNDLRTILAVLVQVGMVVGRLESLRELRVIILFHIVGTVMELFKTGIGSWIYAPGGLLHIGNVPLFSGFMYAAVGSYMVRVFRLFELRFDRYPPRWMGGVLAGLIYLNFFTAHWIVDLRWALIAAIVVLFWNTSMEARVLRIRLRMPLLAAFLLVAFFIWLAENVGTASGTWLYPSQLHGWQLVPLSKMASWFLLMMISVALVTWVYPPQPPALPVPRSRYPERVHHPANDPTFDDVWDELVWRGLVHVSTDQAELKKLLAGPPITFYCGFDPTAPSLHLGNLVQLLTMRRIQLAGHKPLGLVGGSTGLIGDPKSTTERTLHSKEQVAEWVAKLRAQVERFLSFDGTNAARMVNNLDWTQPMSVIDYLRDIGKHYRVGTMVKKDIVASRLNSAEGISYTEFSYQILQGLDFRHLYLEHGCVLQTGGSDQWGNLTSGVDLIHRAEGAMAHAIGTPLITDADGKKFGKSEGNAVWLDSEMMSPYGFYQFWLNSDDAIVVGLLKVFTFLSRAEIEELEAAVRDEPFRRAAQRTLANEVTSLVHGEAATAAVIAASEALFGQGDLAALDAATLASAVAELPSARGGADTPIAQLLLDAGLTSSLGESRRAIEQGGVYLNNARVDDTAAVLGDRLLAGGVAVLRRGKRTLAGIRSS